MKIREETFCSGSANSLEHICLLLHFPLAHSVLVSSHEPSIISLQEEEEQEEDDDEDEDDTDDLDELDTDQLLDADLEEEENNENAGEDGENDFSPSDDEELANLLEEGDEGEDEDSDADEEVELILGDSKYSFHRGQPLDESIKHIRSI